MKVLEIKNNLVKISFTPEDNLFLGGFVIIEDEQTPYVAQVFSLKADNGMNYAIVRLLFTFNTEGIVKNYDGTIPSLDASITKLSSDELLDILPVNTPLEIGELAQQKELLKVDSSILEKNLLVCSENQENSNILTGNFLLQLENNNDKSLVFDIDGSFPGTKLKFGEDFKLPLNYDTINYIYEHDLNDVEPVSKAIIQDIFLEVQEYSKTVLDKFIPFDTFINVVDQQYRATGIPELVLLKNKLLKYKEQNVFAQDAKDFQCLRGAIRANLTNVLDISTAEGQLQNEIMSYVYDAVDELDLFVYSFVQFTNDNADKKLIRHLITKDKIYTTIICSHNFKYLYELKERANNYILFAPQVLQHDFAAYNTFLNKLNPDEFVIYGKATQNIPLIVELAEIETETEETPEQTADETSEENPETQEQQEQTEPEEEKPDDFSDESNSYSYETLLEDTAIQQPETEQETETQDTADVEQQEEQEQASNIIPSAGNILEDNEPEPKPEVIIAAPEQISDMIDAEIQEEAAKEPEISEPDAEKEPEAVVEETQSENAPSPEIVEPDTLPEIPEITDENTEIQEIVTSPDFSETEIIETVTSEQPQEPEIVEETAGTQPEQPAPANTTADEDEEEGFPEVLDVPEPDVETITGLEPLTEDFNEDLSVIQPISDEPIDIPVLEYNDNSLQILDEPEIVEDTIPIDKVAKDVDEILFSQGKEEFPPLEPLEETEMPEERPVPESDLTEDDLNFIEDINNVEEDKPPVVPVYPVDDMIPVGEVPVFAQGDRVKHPKYGEGVVEKMIKYGNKTLCSINFVNVGRRLLDPAISELSKA